MKLLVFGHRLEVGGTQVNAIEIATTLRDRHGVDILFFAAPGPMLDRVRAEGLRFVPAPDVRLHPSPRRMRALRELVRDEKPDLVHAWDWWQGLEAYCGVHLTQGMPLIVSDMMMELTRVLPRSLPTTFGTAATFEAARRSGWKRTMLLVPPVDTDANHPEIVDRRAARGALALGEDEIALVSVSRLATVMKAESLVRAMDVVRRLGRELPLKLVIVGDGEAAPQLRDLAAGVNRDLGREGVALVGEMLDPTAAYAAADIIMGMGGSALRAMAFAKPVVIVGRDGFAEAFSPETRSTFLRIGMYGIGGGDPANAAMERVLRALAGDARLRDDLGRFGRDFVVEHHSLGGVTDRFMDFCEAAIAARRETRPAPADILRTAFVYARERRFLTTSRDRLPAEARTGG